MTGLRNIVSACVHNSVLSNILMVSILAGGILALAGLVSETYPDFSLDTISVEVAYPGASAEEIEQGVCRKIEESLDGLVGIKRMWSRASENLGLVIVELQTDAADPRLMLLDIKDRVNRISSFPAGSEAPVVSELVGRTKVINVAVHGSAGEKALKECASSIRDELLRAESISQIQMTGERDYELSIQVRREELLRYGMTLQDVATVVARNSLDTPAGVLRTSDEELALRTIGKRYSAADFADVVLLARSDGTMVRLGQVASITDTFVENYDRGRFQGSPAIMLEIFRTTNQGTRQIARTVRDYVRDKKAALPQGLHVDVWGDNARQVEARISMLIENAVLGILLVVLVLTLFLDFRVSLYVALGIPVSFAGALLVMRLTGQTINMITLFGLIMVTGIIVDDAIVIADGFRQRMEQRLQPAVAAIEGTCDLALPVLSSSVTTILAFVPLFFIAGVMGKLIAVLPTVVVSAVVFSSIEAFLILPGHLQHCLKQREQSSSAPSMGSAIRRRVGQWLDILTERLYRPVCQWLLLRRGLLLASTLAIALITAGLVAGGRIRFTLLPEMDSNVLRARARFVQGVPAAQIEQAVLEMEQAAERLNEPGTIRHAGQGLLVIQTFSSIGEWSGWVSERGSNLCEVMIELLPAEQRQLDSGEVLAAWSREVGQLRDTLSLTYERVAGGPKDKPLEVHLLSDDLGMLEKAARDSCRYLSGYAHVFEIEHDLHPGRREVVVKLKPLAQTLGVTLDTIAQQLHTGFFGGEAVRLQRGRDEVGVQVRYPVDQRRSISDIENLHIRNSSGLLVPFNQLAEYELQRGSASIYRQQGQRRVRVTANVDERRANTAQILARFEADYLRHLEDNFPGVRYMHGGERAVITESMDSLIKGSVVALFAIYAVLTCALRSYLQPLVIMAAVPLGFVGAVLGHLITGYDLNMLSVFGMVALSGVVVNDALVLLDQLNASVNSGVPAYRAAVQAGQRRFRAVFLTTLTTVVGLLPLLLERSSQAQHLIPMAVSLTFGLAFASLVTLMVVPACYLVLQDLKAGLQAWRRVLGPIRSRVLEACAG